MFLLLGRATFLLAATTTTRSVLEPIGLETPGDTFETLSTGVKVKTMKQGVGEDLVSPKSTVLLQIKGRLLNLNGVKFYDTDGLVVTLGSGQVIPGLEDGIVGMKKNEIRRILVPANRGYRENEQVEPWPADPQALYSVLQNPRRDATILFDVKVDRISSKKQ